jgi:hypothetical protein
MLEDKVTGASADNRVPQSQDPVSLLVMTPLMAKNCEWWNS